MEFEAKIIEFLQTNATTGWITFFECITMLGGYLGFFLVFVLLFFKRRSLAYAFAITFALASIVNYLLKIIIGRPRPFDSFPSIKNLGEEDGFSMPSGHSLCAGLFATFLFYLTIKSAKNKSTKVCACIAICLFPPLIALSRMVLGVHYLTDTILGIFLGIIFALIGIFIYNVVAKRIKINQRNKINE